MLLYRHTPRILAAADVFSHTDIIDIYFHLDVYQLAQAQSVSFFSASIGII